MYKLLIIKISVLRREIMNNIEFSHFWWFFSYVLYSVRFADLGLCYLMLFFTPCNWHKACSICNLYFSCQNGRLTSFVSNNGRAFLAVLTFKFPALLGNPNEWYMIDLESVIKRFKTWVRNRWFPWPAWVFFMALVKWQRKTRVSWKNANIYIYIYVCCFFFVSSFFFSEILWLILVSTLCYVLTWRVNPKNVHR